MQGPPAMTESTVPAGPPSTAISEKPPTPSQEAAGKSLSSLVLHLSEGFDESANLSDLLRTAGRHVRKLVDCVTARIWLARRAGRRLVARDFSSGDAPPTMLWADSDEGLAGWVFSRGDVLRLGAGDPRPSFKGAVPEFRSALVMPLYRRGEVFAAIECLDKRDGGDF